MISERRPETGERRGLAPRASCERCEAGEREREHAHRREGQLDRHGLRHATEHGPEDGAEDRHAEGRPDDLAASLSRRGDGDPGERPGPGRGARDTLDEARGAESGRAVREREAEARERQQHEAADHGALGAEAGGREPARDAAEERARSVRADEQSGAGLREVELLGVCRYERRQRGEQQRVDEDDRADEDEQPAHANEDMRPKKMHRAGGDLVRLPD